MPRRCFWRRVGTSRRSPWRMAPPPMRTSGRQTKRRPRARRTRQTWTSRAQSLISAVLDSEDEELAQLSSASSAESEPGAGAISSAGPSGDVAGGAGGEQEDGDSLGQVLGEGARPVGHAQPPPEPPQAMHARAARLGISERGHADATVRLPSGCTISYYSANQNVQAVCCAHLGRNPCRLTRTSRASDVASRRGQGGPLGLMAAWCELGHIMSDQGEHRAAFAMSLFQVPENRRSARATLMTCLGAQLLASFERPRRGDEDEDEPSACP